MSSIQTQLLSKPLPLAEAQPGSPNKPRISVQDPEKVAKDFESVFASMMLKEMRKTLESGNLFTDDPSDVYGGLFDQFMGQHIAGTRGLGLANMVREGLERFTANPENKASLIQGLREAG